VRAIRLGKADRLSGMDVVDKKADLLVVTRNGFGKRTPLNEYTPRGRGTMGVMTLNREKLGLTGPIAAARVVHADDDLTIISSGGIVMRTKMDQIKRAGRATMGVHVVNLKEGDIVAGVATFPSIDQPGADEPKKSA
jgi:DNA gyrase subunit A